MLELDDNACCNCVPLFNTLFLNITSKYGFGVFANNADAQVVELCCK